MGRRTQRWRIFNARRRLAADERGVALVEFALVLPLILLLLFGMIDFGKAFNYWNDETHLANEGARAVAVNNSPDPNWAIAPCNKTCSTAKINTAIKNQADSGELRSGGLSISAPDGSPGGVSICIWFPGVAKGTSPVPSSAWQTGQPVQVVVKARYNWLAYLVGKKAVPASSVLTATSTMRIEQTPTNPTSASSTDAYTASTNNTC